MDPKARFYVRNIFDGELVNDDLNSKRDAKPWRKAGSPPIFLVFDALIIDGQNLMPLNFTERLLKASEYML